MPFYLYLALKQLFPTGRGVSFFALLAILGVGLGVMVLVVVQSVMNGFGHKLRNSLNQQSGDIRIIAQSPIRDPQYYVDQFDQLPEVEVSEPYAEGIVMIQHEGRPSFPIVYGLNVQQERHALPVEEYLTHGTLDDLDDERAFLGKHLAMRLGVGIGDVIDIYTPLLLERLKRDEVLLPRTIEVAGIIESGFNEIDSKLIVVTLRTMQELYGLEKRIHGFVLDIKDGISVQAFARKLEQEILPGHLRAQTWMDKNESFFSILALEQTVMLILNFVIVLVASFAISVSLYTSVLRKTREIGLLGAMGARPWGIATIFCAQGTLVGNAGFGFGLLAAWGLLSMRDTLLDLLFMTFVSEEDFGNFYYFRELPIRYEAGDIFQIYLLTVVLTTLVSIIPALTAARKKAADALRYE